MFLGVLAAIKARLEGKPEDYIPQLAGVARDPGGLQARDKGLQAPNTVLKQLTEPTKARIRQTKTTVPVRYFANEGFPFAEANPCITYDVIDIEPRKEDRKGRTRRPIRAPIPGTETTVRNDFDEVVGSGSRMAMQRDEMAGFNFTVEIRAYSRENVMSALLTAFIWETFPERHFIILPFADGSHRSVDMRFLTYKDLDQREAVITGAATREYAKSWTYVVEGFLDNTLDYEYINLVPRASINLATKDT